MQVEEPREREIDVYDLVQGYAVVESAELSQVLFSQGQRSVRAKRSPLCSCEAVVSGQRHQPSTPRVPTWEMTFSLGALRAAVGEDTTVRSAILCLRPSDLL